MSVRFGARNVRVYCGPSDVWRRFMAGMPVTREDLLADESPWWVRPTPKDHLARLQKAVQ